MSNNYFKFKKFIIYQDKCAMKVCTDACLFGALLPTLEINNAKILDVGTGTGLLSLMFFQNNETSLIDAIEINENAYQQAFDNILLNRFSNNINVILGDIRFYETKILYDIIFCNPPFFVNDLKSQNAEKNIALHSQMLSYEELIIAVEKLLSADGFFYVLLPFINETIFINIAKKYQLFAVSITRVKQTNKHTFFRSIVCFAKQEKMCVDKSITIKNEADYSPEFTALLKEYYLFF